MLFGLFCGALFTAVIGTMGAKFVIGLYRHRPGLADLEVPTLDRLLAVPLGSYLMCFRFLQVPGLLADGRVAAP